MTPEQTLRLLLKKLEALMDEKLSSRTPDDVQSRITIVIAEIEKARAEL